MSDYYKAKNGDEFEITYQPDLESYCIARWNGKKYSFGYGKVPTYNECIREIESGRYYSKVKMFKIIFICIAIYMVGFFLFLFLTKQ